MLTTKTAIEGFFQSIGVLFKRDVLLSTCCTWKIGGLADFLIEPASWKQVALVLRYAGKNDIPTVVIGQGSNLLFDDAGLQGIVIKIGRRLSHINIVGTIIHAESGISTPRLARAVSLAGLSGIEHIVGIPGTLGGLVFMNGGSLRKAIGDSITEVKTMDRQGNMRTFRRDECGFAYRHSRFQNEGCVITGTVMELVPGRRDAILARMLQVLRERRKKFPLTLPNCGSVFKSNPRLYETSGSPGKIIETIGLKGTSVGGAIISERHANFIVNKGAATAQDVLSLIARIRARVIRETGFHLKCEVQFVESTGMIRSL